MAETETSVLLCLCGIAIRRPKEQYYEYGFHTNYFNWKEKLIDKNPNTKFTTVCSFDPTNFSSKYHKDDWKENENITSFEQTKKMVYEIFADEYWGFHSIRELDLSKLRLNNISGMGFECSQIYPAIRMKDLHDKVISFDDYDYVIFLRPDSYFREDVILKENTMYLVGDHVELPITKDTRAGGVYFCTLNDWDYSWIGPTKIIKEWITHFSNMHYLDEEEVEKIASTVVSEEDKKFVRNRFDIHDTLQENVNYVENYLYNFRYIKEMQYEGIARLGSPHQDGRPKFGFKSQHGYDDVNHITQRKCIG